MCKFSYLPLLALKFIKFLMPVLEPRVRFSSNFASLFCVVRYNSPVLFHLKLYNLWMKGANQRVNFQAFDCSHENNQISYVIFQAMSSFPLNFVSPFNVMTYNSSEVF